MACGARPGAGSQIAIVAARFAYDVSDPLRPRLLCTATNTVLGVGRPGAITYLRPQPNYTELLERDLASGGERVLAFLPVRLDAGQGSQDWTPDGTLVAYTVVHQPTNGDCCGTQELFVYQGGVAVSLYSYRIGLIGIGGPIRFTWRLGAHISPSRSLVETGGSLGKGSDPGAIFRLRDRARLYTFTNVISDAEWIPGQDRLLVVSDATRLWSPDGSVTVVDKNPWIWPSVSSDGRYAAYSGFDQLGGPQAAPIHIALYDLQTNATVAAPTQPRSQPGFVRDGWLWYLEEAPCSADPQCPWPTRPTGRILAYNLATGSEQAVQFLAGESPVTAQDYFGFQITGVAPGA